VAFLQYTSGSTGDPKGVAVTHGNVMNNEASMSEVLRAGDTSVLVGWIPHWHDMGLMGQLLAFFNGANLVTMSPLAFLKQPIRLLKAISDYRGTITAAPNFAYDLIARRVTPEQLAGLDLSPWEVALNGAEPVRRRTVERITNALAPAGFAPSAMRPAYGMAEVTLMATFSSDGPKYLDADVDALEQHRYIPATGRAIALVSSGAPGPGVEVRIVDPETLREVPDGDVGEIWLRSASVASGYHNRPEQTAEQFRAQTSDGEGPYLRTGDLGLLHDGELYVTGRLKDLLIANGRNLYPQDIEESVQDVHPAVAGSRGCAVSVDVDDAERLVLIQAIKTELLGDTSCGELATAVKTAVARGFEIPAPGVVFVNRAGIHLTTSGKVQRASMREAFLKGELTDVIHQDHPR
jgi:acyl-CoA synthetase (AMP-forming)/AMP-acid ligase II